MNDRGYERIRIISAIAFLVLIVAGLAQLGIITSPVWHDLGVVTQYSNTKVITWDGIEYTNVIVALANVTTTSHGIIHFDSHGSCPFLIRCGNNVVLSMHLNQTIGIVYKQGGWYEVNYP